jgi:hypothetical protein
MSVGERKPLGFACRYCKSEDTWVECRLEVNQMGTWSLAGEQEKATAQSWPYAVCGECGHVSRGQLMELQEES